MMGTSVEKFREHFYVEKTPEEVAEMFDILLQEVLKVKENEKDMKKA